MNQDPLFELTQSPQLNELINKTRALYSGEIDDLQYKDSVKAMNQFRRDFRTFLREQMKFTPKNKLIESEVNKIELSLENIRKSLEEIYIYFSDKNKSHIETGLTDCKGFFAVIWDSINSIQGEEKSDEQYSRAPLQNELMRIGFALAKGQVSKEAFRTKLNSMLQSLKRYHDSFDSQNPMGHEKEYFDQNRSGIKSTVRDYIKALEETENFFMDLNPQHIYDGLKQANKAAEKLLDHQNKMTDGASVKHCVKCGAENSGLTKVCSECGAMILSVGPESSETMAFKFDENGNIQTSDHIETEMTRQVSNGAASVKSGEITKKQFAELIEKTLQKVNQTKTEKEKIQIPEQLRGEHEASPLFLQIEELISLGFKDTVSGLEKMLLYAAGENESQLIFGLEEFLNGTDRLAQAQQMSLSAVGK